jgi:hypothetical protein
MVVFGLEMKAPPKGEIIFHTVDVIHTSLYNRYVPICAYMRLCYTYSHSMIILECIILQNVVTTLSCYRHYQPYLSIPSLVA